MVAYSSQPENRRFRFEAGRLHANVTGARCSAVAGRIDIPGVRPVQARCGSHRTLSGERA